MKRADFLSMFVAESSPSLLNTNLFLSLVLLLSRSCTYVDVFLHAPLLDYCFSLFQSFFSSNFFSLLIILASKPCGIPYLILIKVKPVYNDQLGDPKIVSIDRWSLFKCAFVLIQKFFSILRPKIVKAVNTKTPILLFIQSD